MITLTGLVEEDTALRLAGKVTGLSGLAGKDTTLRLTGIGTHLSGLAGEDTTLTELVEVDTTLSGIAVVIIGPRPAEEHVDTEIPTK